MEKNRNEKRNESEFDSKVNRSDDNQLDYGEGRGQFERSTGNRGTQSHQGRYGKWNSDNIQIGGSPENFDQSGGYGESGKLGKVQNNDSIVRDDLGKRAMMGRREYEIRNDSPSKSQSNASHKENIERKDQGYDFLNLGY